MLKVPPTMQMCFHEVSRVFSTQSVDKKRLRGLNMREFVHHAWRWPHHCHSHSLGQNLVSGPHLAEKEAGK